jgi:ArsR family transcriptional regulator, arsenate/arsenite/antimonite-responsive transcriptional repressor
MNICFIMKHPNRNEYKEEEIRLARFAKALGHPARISILRFLASKNCCYCGMIVDELPIAQATVSQHLKELKDAGLIQGSIEIPKVRYCIDPGNWKIAQELFEGFWRQQASNNEK